MFDFFSLMVAVVALIVAAKTTGTLSALALALTFALDKGMLSIAIALMSLGTAWVSMQRPIPFLRSLAAILAAIVVMRTVYEPRIAGDAVGTTPIFNWLLWGYGVAALSWHDRRRAIHLFDHLAGVRSHSARDRYSG